jgi:hypothetical protein
VRFLRTLDVEPSGCLPHRPAKKPFVERCIGTLKHEWLARSAPTTLGAALDALLLFPAYYTNPPATGHRCVDPAGWRGKLMTGQYTPEATFGRPLLLDQLLPMTHQRARLTDGLGSTQTSDSRWAASSRASTQAAS